ncbi:MAG TPA: SAM-dependent methyltransferase [Spirochaetia bacterium]|nr:MAG: methyltransferase [Spirochaetes bacterium GWB1_36_13]HCL57760.1 SAM-dependent methyltransferase [Spirochaetia bacterium]
MQEKPIKRNFDKEAALWDNNPVRVKLAKDVSEKFLSHAPITPDMKMMDFGCGTGLISLYLKPFVHSITGIDSSKGMLEILRKKLDDQKIHNIFLKHKDIEQGDSLEGSFDIIISNMTFHHIEKINPVLKEFYRIMSPSGILAVADLDLDNGEFHENNAGVFHSGFDRKSFETLFQEAGFHSVQSFTAAEVTKPSKDGSLKTFTIFMTIGRK